MGNQMNSFLGHTNTANNAIPMNMNMLPISHTNNLDMQAVNPAQRTQFNLPQTTMPLSQNVLQTQQNQSQVRQNSPFNMSNFSSQTQSSTQVQNHSPQQQQQVMQYQMLLQQQQQHQQQQQQQQQQNTQHPAQQGPFHVPQQN